MEFTRLEVGEFQRRRESLQGAQLRPLHTAALYVAKGASAHAGPLRELQLTQLRTFSEPLNSLPQYQGTASVAVICE